MSASHLLVDVGNSAIKWCLATGTTLGAVHQCPRDIDAFTAMLIAESVPKLPIGFATVAGQLFEEESQNKLGSLGYGEMHIVRAPREAMGLTNSYEIPEMMGVDRWLAMLAAWQQKPTATLVVDSGTALTLDLVSNEGQHEGGYIIPGLRLMQSALFQGTDRVRFERSDTAHVAPGQSTDDCVASGVWAALLGSLRLVASRHPDHRIVVTGGSGRQLLSLGVNGEWRPHLVLEGLAHTMTDIS